MSGNLNFSAQWRCPETFRLSDRSVAQQSGSILLLLACCIQEDAVPTAKDAVAFLTDDDFNMYLGTLLQALELGRYRVGFPKG